MGPTDPRRVDDVETRRITAEDVLRPDGPWQDCEIWDGLPMVREPSGGRAEFVASRVIVRLGRHVEANANGRVVLSSQGFLLARNPDRLLASDGAYISKERLPRVPRRGFVEAAPEFVIEVRSPTDSWEAVVEKCGLWIAHGTLCAWAIDPDEELVAVFRPGTAPEVLRGRGRASAAPALPEFALDVAPLFEDLG